MTTKNFGILIHGGAGSSKRVTHSKEEADIIKIIKQAACNGFDFLKSNYNIHTNNSTTAASAALDAVEIAVAIIIMEQLVP
jgi:isoaspartyl peptidase/L-asparaginase-like protein (Ntn-hydrolase superfamily)